MLPKFPSIFIYLAMVFMFSACKDADEYSVDDAFAVYLHRFEDDAALHGRHFDFVNTGLILEFADLKGSDAGLCHPNERPIRIEFDRTYWNAISKKEGADLMKENLIYHELGHGPLGREHLNTTMANGEWNSMMCGGDKVNDRSWNIDFRGMRRTYYIDELFDENTEQPAFSSINLPIDTTLYNTDFLSLSFDIPADAGWSLVDSSTYKMSIDNGKFCFESKIDKSFFITINLASRGLSLLSDFSYELTLIYPINGGNGQYGIVMGATPTAATPSILESLDYFSLNNSRYLFAGNSRWYSYFTQLPISSYFVAGENKLKVIKLGIMAYLFVNGHFVYQSEIETSFQGTHVGFLAPALSQLWIDNLAVKVKSGLGMAAKISQDSHLPLEFTVTEFDSNPLIISSK